MPAATSFLMKDPKRTKRLVELASTPLNTLNIFEDFCLACFASLFLSFVACRNDLRRFITGWSQSPACYLYLPQRLLPHSCNDSERENYSRSFGCSSLYPSDFTESPVHLCHTLSSDVSLVGVLVSPSTEAAPRATHHSTLNQRCIQYHSNIRRNKQHD